MNSPVLIVEDDHDIRELISARIRRLGGRPLGAVSGEEGLRLAEAEPPRLVVLDIRLPGMDGWEFLRKLRERPATANVPVLVVSIVDNDAVAGQPPVEGYLVKPFRAAAIDDLAAKFLDRDEAEDEG